MLISFSECSWLFQLKNGREYKYKAQHKENKGEIMIFPVVTSVISCLYCSIAAEAETANISMTAKRRILGSFYTNFMLLI